MTPRPSHVLQLVPGARDVDDVTRAEPLDDATLMARTAADDAAAFELLVERHADADQIVVPGEDLGHEALAVELEVGVLGLVSERCFEVVTLREDTEKVEKCVTKVDGSKCQKVGLRLPAQKCEEEAKTYQEEQAYAA